MSICDLGRSSGLKEEILRFPSEFRPMQAGYSTHLRLDISMYQVLRS